LSFSSQRRTLLLAAVTAPLFLTMSAYASSDAIPATASASLAELEHEVGGRLGVYARDTAPGSTG